MQTVLFWLNVATIGLFGAYADIRLNRWSDKLSSASLWATAAVYFLVFMTWFGLTMHWAAVRGNSLTFSVLVVLMSNIMGVAIWDLIKNGTRFNSWQWIGAGLAIGVILCFELGKKSTQG